MYALVVIVVAVVVTVVVVVIIVVVAIHTNINQQYNMNSNNVHIIETTTHFRQNISALHYNALLQYHSPQQARGWPGCAGDSLHSVWDSVAVQSADTLYRCVCMLESSISINNSIIIKKEITQYKQ